jgi:hypothetical protein
LDLQCWEVELGEDTDREFLLAGIRDGFHIVSDFDFKPVECENYQSALAVDAKAAVEAQICEELVEGRYEIVREKPTIISALGAIRKSNGKIRLIHDASRPVGMALNDYAQMEYALKFQSLKDAEALLMPNAYMAKIDLKSAYRSVAIHPDDYVAAGLKWQFSGDDQAQYMVDKRLPFGSRFSPGVFHRLTQAVRRVMCGYGFPNMFILMIFSLSKILRIGVWKHKIV